MVDLCSFRTPRKRALKELYKVLFLVSLVLSVGCASYTDDTREIRSLYRSDQHTRALELIEDSDLKEESRNRLLYRLEKAMILDRMGRRPQARKLLLEADKIADELYTVSISKTVTSFLYNDSATDYAGEDFEKVAIHTQLALSFLEDRDYPAARVQAAKINTKSQEINNGYEEGKNKYSEDAFARYLAGIIYEKRGEWDSAIIDYTKALKLYEGPYGDFVSSTPDSLVTSLWRMLVKRNRKARLAVLKKDYPKLVQKAEKQAKSIPKAGELITIHEAGHIATKKPQSFVFQVGSQVIRYSWPSFQKRTSTVWGRTGMEVAKASGGARQFYRAEQVQNLDDIAKQTLDDRRGRMILKESARLLAKGQVAEQARQNFGLLGGIAVNVYNLISETADTRSWTLLPESYSISRVRLQPGTYKVHVKTGGRIGKIQTIKLKAGEMVILRDVG